MELYEQDPKGMMVDFQKNTLFIFSSFIEIFIMLLRLLFYGFSAYSFV